MLSYESDDTFVHRLDPRSKLAFQAAFALTALAHTGPRALAALTVLTGLVLVAAGVSLWRSLYAYRFAVPVLLAGPLVSALTLGSPWIDLESAIEPARASYRVLLVLLVSAAYVRSTPIRDSRAAIQRTVPGKPGQLLGIGVALVFRFLPVLRADLRTIREAIATRLGDQRGPVDRAGRLGTLGLVRVFARADRLSLALQARCFSWNPTLPRLAFARADAPVLACAALLVLSAFV